MYHSTRAVGGQTDHPPVRAKWGKNDRKRWNYLLASCARATRTLGRCSLGLMARLGVPVGGRVRKPRAVGGQTGHPPVKRRLRLDFDGLHECLRQAQSSGTSSVYLVQPNKQDKPNQPIRRGVKP